MWIKSLKQILTAGRCAFLPIFLLISTAMSAEEGGEILLRLVNGNQNVELDRAALETLPQTRFETETSWTDGKVFFSGPTLMSVLELAGIAGQPVVATAVNAYEATIPAALIEENVPIIATRMNGETFDIRDNGPLWIVFPYDLDKRFQSESVFSSSVWQLIQLKPHAD